MIANLSISLKALHVNVQSVLRREEDFKHVIPSVATLFVTYRCNSKCKTCTMWKRPQDEEIRKEVDRQSWRIIVDKLAAAGILTVEVFGGNALLRKDIVLDLMEHLYAKGISIHMPTNLMGFDDDVAEATAKYAEVVYLSIDGLGDDQDQVRGIDGVFNQVESAIEKLHRFRRQEAHRSKPVRIVCNCTVSKYNVHLLEDMIPYAIDRGFDEIAFEYAGEFEREDVDASAVIGVIPDAQYIRLDESILAGREEAARIKASMRKIRKAYKDAPIDIRTVNIDSLSLRDLYEGTIPHQKCYVERIEVTIDPYGNIVICPFITNYILGNLVDEPFESIWNNEKHKRFRQFQNDGKLPMCRSCILGVQRNPGLLKSLQRIYLTKIQPKLL